MKLEPGCFCPLLGKECIKLECSWFTQLRGVDPQTGKDIDDWGCAIAWLPALLIENSGQQRSTASEVEALRNQIFRKQKEMDRFNPLNDIKLKTYTP
tara:strand:- start:580 stop:870 length:291 start_codon:yes stop_codon:yes gene_type:complete